MPRLEPRPLGRTGLSVTPLALAGGGVQGWGDRSRKLTPEDFEAAYYEFGINTFFAPWMFKALTEGVRRLVRDGHRDKLTLIAEVGIPFGAAVRHGWELSARKLGVDTIDVFLLGWVQASWYFKFGTWKTLEKLKAEGRARAIGISAHDRPLAARLARAYPLDVLMIRYNAAHRGAEREVFEVLGEQCPAVISYTATRWGMLLQPLPHARFPQPMTAGECYRFVLGHPAVDTALCAATSRAEIVEAVLAGPLPLERLSEVRRFGDAVHATAKGGKRWMFHGRTEPRETQQEGS